MEKRGREINLPLIIIGAFFILAIFLLILIIKPTSEFKNIDSDIVNLDIKRAFEDNESIFVDIEMNIGTKEIVGIKFILSDGEKLEIMLIDVVDKEPIDQFIIIPGKLIAEKVKWVSIAPILLFDGQNRIGKVSDIYILTLDKGKDMPDEEGGNISDMPDEEGGNISDMPDEEECTPNCVGLQCGIEPVCGQSCGECKKIENCINGICTCVPNWTVDSWSSCSNGTQTRTVADSNNCDIMINKPTTSQTCIPPILESYLSENPLVKDYIENLNLLTRSYFYSEFYELNTTGNISLDEEVKKIQAAKIARSIWIDINNMVPWKLKDYSNEDLAIIFKYNPYEHVPDCDPIDTYQYVKDYINNTKIDTISAIIDSLRRYSHAIGPWGTNDGIGCLRDMLKRNSIMGCHASSQMMANLITAVNIPAYYRYNPASKNWFVGGHGGLVVPNIGYISHGDNIYGNTIRRNIPSKELLIPWDVLQNEIIPKQSDPSYTFGSGRNLIEQRYMFDLLKKYPPTMEKYTPYSSCLKAAHEMGDGVATIDEITQMAQSWNCWNYSSG